MRRAIEAKARIPITGIACNANLMEATREEDILDGYAFASRVAAAAGLPLLFVTAASGLLTRLDKKSIQCPVLEIKRQLVPPWLHAEGMAPTT